MKKKKKIQYTSIFAIIFIIASIYLIQAILLFNKIETFLRYSIIGVIALIDLFIFYKLFFAKKKKKKKHKIVYSIILIIFSGLFLFLGFNLNRIYSYFSNLNKKVVYSISLVTLKENKDVSLSTLKDKKIGVNTTEEHNLSDQIVEKYSLSKNNELIEYEDWRKMILDLYDKKVDYIFLQTNYVDIYSTDENFEDIGDKIATVDTTQKVVTKEEVQLSGSSKDVSEPFTILLMGIDSTVDGLENADSFNGDSLIVVTFNPKTMSATMLSIPRDSYVPITCMNNVDNKITHAASGGARCVINTLQKLLDIKIDYYLKINFTGVVDLVDTLGGVEIDVPYKICEQNSKRQFGKNTIYINEGHQLLNGEQALAYSRNRKSNAGLCNKQWTTGERSDFVRSEHQQEVITAVLEKMKTFTSISDLEKLLKVISKNLDTNMSESTIFSFYNIGKDVLLSSSSDSVITIQKLYLDGTGQMIYDERSGLVLWDYILNKSSLNAVKTAMKDNLSGKKHELVKDFNYSIKDNYEIKVIGKGYYNTEKYTLLPDMVGWTQTKAQDWLKEHGIKAVIEYTESSKANGTVVEQQYPEKKRVDLINNKQMVLKIARKGGSANADKVDCLIDEENEKCIVPDFKGKTMQDFNSWANGFSNTINAPTTTGDKDGKIKSQSIAAGTKVKDILDGGLTMALTFEEASGGTDNPGGNTTDNPGGNTTDNPGGNTTDNPGGNTTDNPGGNTTDNPGGNTTDNQTGGGNTTNPEPENTVNENQTNP